MMQEKPALVKLCSAQCQAPLVPRSEEEKTVMSKARDESKTSGNPGFKCRIYGNSNCFKNAYIASAPAFQDLFFIALQGWFC